MNLEAMVHTHTHTQWDTIQLYIKMKSFNEPLHRWNYGILYVVKSVRRGKDTESSI